MPAQIVFDDPTNPPVTGSVERANSFLSQVFALSNFDDSGVLGWRWTLLYRPIGSAAALSAPNSANTDLTPDVAGPYLVRLETFADVARTQLLDVDEQVLSVAFPAPFDWHYPAAGETTQRGVHGWAPIRERAIRDVHDFVEDAWVPYRFSVTTTNATPTLLFSIPLDDNTLNAFRVVIIGRDIAGAHRAMYQRLSLIYRQGGGIALDQSNQTIGVDVETNAALNGAVSADGANNYAGQVTGLAATTIHWHAIVERLSIS